MDVEPIMQERRVLHVLMQIYEDHIQNFKIGETHLLFRPKDVDLIMGLHYEGDIISFKYHK